MMTNFLFIFLDGVGLGENNPETNPFTRAKIPTLNALLHGRSLIASNAPFNGSHASLLALDACLGVAGLPQSATGQATLLTGINIPISLGYHYGPKPNPPIAGYLKTSTLFSRLSDNGLRARFLNAYPPRYFAAIESGKRIYSAIPLAVISAGLPLLNIADLQDGMALAADFTGQGWRDHLNLTGTPILSPQEAGTRLANLSSNFDFAFFEYWLSDYAGHRQDMSQAIQLLEVIDQVIEGLVNAWDSERGLILLTSDHGNMEDLSTRRHTRNPVPALLIGSPGLRDRFSAGLRALTDIAPAISRLLIDGSGLQ
jgi:2,3-bisphosphoglycerate-independent phosphoglycerate mutase